MGRNLIQFDLTILSTLLSLILLVFVIYLIVSAIRFFKRRESTEKELIHKLDEVIKLHSQQSDK